jgi:hypothetical protein
MKDTMKQLRQLKLKKGFESHMFGSVQQHGDCEAVKARQTSHSISLRFVVLFSPIHV